MENATDLHDRPALEIGSVDRVSVRKAVSHLLWLYESDQVEWSSTELAERILSLVLGETETGAPQAYLSCDRATADHC